MSRIDVVPAAKGKFKVLVNFQQRGIEYNNAAQANKEAQTFHDIERPTFDLNLAKIEDK